MTSDIRICFVGDSFVNGTGDETALGWAGRLCAAANRSGHAVTYYNLGVRRNTSTDILRRWQQECAPRLPRGCDGRVVFSMGVNDTAIEEGKPRIDPDESCRNLRRMLRDAGEYKALVVGPPPVDEQAQNERIQHVCRTFAREAAALGVPYIELFSSLVADRAYMQEIAASDGAHPTAEGYAKMAAIIASSSRWWFPET